MVAGEHKSAVCGQILDPARAEAIAETQIGPSGGRDEAVHGSRTQQRYLGPTVPSNGKHKRLVIVESPAKAKTIAGYLGDDFVVESSVGHIRDLPERAADIPAEYKKEKWARLGVNVEDDFRPLYVVDPDKKKKVSELKKLLKDADELLLATDEDREGEAIAWHLFEVLKPEGAGQADGLPRDHEGRDRPRARGDARHRRAARRRAGDAPHPRPPLRLRDLARPLEEDHARPFGRSRAVGRDAARRRARARAAWRSALRAGGTSGRPSIPIRSRRGSSRVDGKRLALGRDFGPDGQLKNAEALQLNEEEARGLAARLEQSSFHVGRVERKPYSRRPSPPFMTSTLQQEASRKLRYTAQTTMRIAQRLYENGYITYMRTDSTTLSESALTAARHQAARAVRRRLRARTRRAATSAR